MEKELLQVILAKGAFFEGELRFKGTARIAGHLKGSVKGSGSLIIESSAKVEGGFRGGSSCFVGRVLRQGQSLQKCSYGALPPAFSERF